MAAHMLLAARREPNKVVPGWCSLHGLRHAVLQLTGSVSQGCYTVWSGNTTITIRNITTTITRSTTTITMIHPRHPVLRPLRHLRPGKVCLFPIWTGGSASKS